MVSGLLMAGAFRAEPLQYLAWIAPVPFLYVLPRTSADRAWLLGSLLALVFYRLGADWLIAIGGYRGAAFMAVYALWMGLCFRVTRLLVGRYGLTALCWAWPVAFVGQEIVRCEWPARYRFAYLAWGYSQPGDGWIANAAALGGIHLVSLLLVSMSGAIAYALLRRRWRSLISCVAVGTLTVGLPALVPKPQPDAGRRIAVACVQAEEAGYRELMALTRRAAEDPSHPKLIVLPEHAISDLVCERHPVVRGLSVLAREHAAYICVGAHVPAPPGLECDYDNVGLLLGPDGHIVFQQAKAVPVPCFYDGNPAQRFGVANMPLGVAAIYICYDGDFTDIPRRYASMGAELFLVPVMNPESWPSAQREQQARMAIYRAIECGRPSVRAASSGTSQIIDCDARQIGERLQAEGTGYLCGVISPSSARTWFVRGGFLLAKGFGWAYVLVIAMLTLEQWSRSWLAGRGVTRGLGWVDRPRVAKVGAR